jgi:hypothetical protein
MIAMKALITPDNKMTVRGSMLIMKGECFFHAAIIASAPDSVAGAPLSKHQRMFCCAAMIP